MQRFLSEKLERKAIQLDEIRGLSDLVGLRIILQFRRDVEQVCTSIRSHFAVSEEYDTADRLKEDQFGYSSYHFVVALPDAWLSVPTLSTLQGFKAEIQVRTTAQHIWAAASHTLQYKQESAVPPTVRRAIHRVSALLETVDLEFERVLSERAEYRAGAQQLPESEPLNVDLLEEVLDSILPSKNKKVGAEPYAELLKDLQHFDIKTRKQLSEHVMKHLPLALEADAQRVKQYSDDPNLSKLFRVAAERLAAGVFFTHVGLARQAIGQEFGDRWKEYQAKKVKVRPIPPLRRRRAK